MSSATDKHICPASGKICYSRVEAGIVMRTCSKRNGRRFRKQIPRRAYFCPDCGCYHLTHWKNFMPKKRRF